MWRRPDSRLSGERTAKSQAEPWLARVAITPLADAGRSPPTAFAAPPARRTMVWNWTIFWSSSISDRVRSSSSPGIARTVATAAEIAAGSSFGRQSTGQAVHRSAIDIFAVDFRTLCADRPLRFIRHPAAHDIAIRRNGRDRRVGGVEVEIIVGDLLRGIVSSPSVPVAPAD